MLGRISGLVLPGGSRRQGTSNAGNAYDFTLVNVLVAGRDVATIQHDTANDLGPAGTPWRANAGDVVDLLVEFGVYRNEVSARLVAPEYPDDALTLDSLLAAASAAS